MNQLVNPNLNAVGQIGYCLAYAGPGVYGTTYVPDPPYASEAWKETKLQHSPSEALPTDVAVPVWFSYVVNGYDEGHVVISVPGKGFYSSPWAVGTTHAVLPSISEVIRIYSDNGEFPMAYVGWSEDILNLRVVEDEMWSNGDTYNLLFKSVNAGTAEQAKNANYVGFFGAQNGQDFKTAFYEIINSPQYAFMVSGAQNPGAIPVVTVNGLEYVPKA